MFSKFHKVGFLSVLAIGAFLLMAFAPVAQTPTAQPASTSNATVMVAANSSLGKILVTSQGMTLYMFKNDTANTDTCVSNTACASLWTPYTIPSGQTPMAGTGVTGTLGTISLPDGSLQVTVNKMPLYTNNSDTKAGDTNGQAYKNLWYALNPAGNPVTTSASTTPTVTPSSSNSGNSGYSGSSSKGSGGKHGY